MTSDRTKPPTNLNSPSPQQWAKHQLAATKAYNHWQNLDQQSLEAAKAADIAHIAWQKIENQPHFKFWTD